MRVYKTRDDEPVGWLKYCSLPIIYPPKFYYLSLRREGPIAWLFGWPWLYAPSNVLMWEGQTQIMITCCSYIEEQQQCWPITMRIFPSLLVLCTEEWQRDKLHRQWWRETKGRLSMCCLHLHGEMKPPWHASNSVLCTCSQDIQKDGQCRALKQVELTYVLGALRIKWARAFTQTGHISGRLWYMKGVLGLYHL